MKKANCPEGLKSTMKGTEIMRLKDKVAIVTGGGVGIGRAIALAFSSEGVALVLASRNLANLEAVAGEIKGKGGQATAIEADVADESQVKRMVAQTLSQYGKVDILVNNSGIAGPTVAVVDLKLEDWNQTIAVDLTGAMLCSREVLKDMIPHESGNIINISSLAGRQGMVFRSPYTVSKWGLIGFTQTLSMEVGKYNIRVNCIAPGPVYGERIENVIKARSKTFGVPEEEIAKQLVSRASLAKFVTAEEVAWAAVFLASDESSGITGQTISVDGGRTSL